MNEIVAIPPSLPPLRKHCDYHEITMRVIATGRAQSLDEAWAVSRYLSHPKTRAAGQQWLDHYGYTPDRFCVLRMLRRMKKPTRSLLIPRGPHQ